MAGKIYAKIDRMITSTRQVQLDYEERASPEFPAAWVLRLLAKTQMRPFEKADWYAYAGCTSKNPMIGEFEGEEFEGQDWDGWILVDGDTVNMGYAGDPYGGRLYTLKDFR